MGEVFGAVADLDSEGGWVLWREDVVAGVEGTELRSKGEEVDVVLDYCKVLVELDEGEVEGWGMRSDHVDKGLH